MNVKQTTQQGVALLTALLFVLIAGSAAMLFFDLKSVSAQRNDRDAVTQNALLAAKRALLDHVARGNLNHLSATNMPGDLPCPDINNSGSAASGCASNAANRLGRLPWLTLGIEPLRDGGGETLWYAISNNYRTASGGSRTFATPGLLGFRSLITNARHDEANQDLVVAVIFAPGTPVLRSGQLQQRTCPLAATQCDPQDKCVAAIPQSAARCDPRQYLDAPVLSDLALAGSDNAAINQASTGSSQMLASNNGFIEIAAQADFNDRAIAITLAELQQAIARRIGVEVANCLASYAKGNLGRYPWAGQLNFPMNRASEVQNLRAGRVPDPTWGLTRLASNNQMSDAGISPSTSEPFQCRIRTDTSSGWYYNWKPSVFYAVSERHKPGTSDLRLDGYANACRSAPGSDCISVDGGVRNVEAVVIVSGRGIAAINQTQPSNSLPDYLEGRNASSMVNPGALPDYDLTRGPTPQRLDQFNDVIVTIP
jgi:hypothetical protein